MNTGLLTGSRCHEPHQTIHEHLRAGVSGVTPSGGIRWSGISYCIEKDIRRTAGPNVMLMSTGRLVTEQALRLVSRPSAH